MSSQSIELNNGHFTGVLHNNEANREKEGSGFNPLFHRIAGHRNLFLDRAVGLNFEHIMNGAAKDADQCMFTPRRDRCYLVRHSEISASIIHRARDSSWNMESEIKYTLSGEHTIDLSFKVIPREDRFPLGFVAFMWASYMNEALDRRIHFRGHDGIAEKWLAFGEDTGNGFETGTVSYYGLPDLPYEEGTKTLNVIEHPEKKFVLPFYYGLMQGSGQTLDEKNAMAYIMMFDQKEQIRFAMWNFKKNEQNLPDTKSPAWDWQYVIHNPTVGRKYGYRARVVFKPFEGREDVLEEYEKWREILS